MPSEAQDTGLGHPAGGSTAQTLRPRHVRALAVDELRRALEGLGFSAEVHGTPAAAATGISMDSREVQEGDLYVAVPGANAHGAS